MQLIQFLIQFILLWSVIGILLMCLVLVTSSRFVSKKNGDVIFKLLIFLGGPLVWLTLLFGKIDKV